MAKLRVVYVKSAIGYSYDQKATIKSLGLRKLNSSVIIEDTPAMRGMAFKVRHLVRVEELAGDSASAVVSPAAAAVVAPAVAAPIAATPVDAAPDATGDDLEVIEGIGPKIAGVLREGGITTFVQLAAMTPEAIDALLKQNGTIRIAHPETWPEQAALAAAGNWDAFKSLTEQLKGGRRA